MVYQPSTTRGHLGGWTKETWREATLEISCDWFLRWGFGSKEELTFSLMTPLRLYGAAGLLSFISESSATRDPKTPVCWLRPFLYLLKYSVNVFHSALLVSCSCYHGATLESDLLQNSEQNVAQNPLTHRCPIKLYTLTTRRSRTTAKHTRLTPASVLSTLLPQPQAAAVWAFSYIPAIPVPISIHFQSGRPSPKHTMIEWWLENMLHEGNRIHTSLKHSEH